MNQTQRRDFWSTPQAAEFTRSQSPILEGDRKRTYVGKNLAVYAIRTGRTEKFGEAWFLDVVTHDGNNWTLPMGKNPKRDGQMTVMQQWISDSGEPILVGFTSYQNEFGDVWILQQPFDDPDGIATPMLPETSPFQAALPESGTDPEIGKDGYDEVPF